MREGEGAGAERLSIDDQATRAEALFTDGAIGRVRAAAAVRAGQPGVCGNCGAQCLPLAVYCDVDCRDDHQARQQVMQRQGRGGVHGA